MTPLVSETRYLLCGEPSLGTTRANPFASAEFTQEFEGKYYFYRLALHEFHRDVPADCFREGVNQEDWPEAFVKPGALTLRGLMDLKHGASLGIDPGLEFAWRRDRVKPLPAGNRTMSESVVLSVP